MSTVLTGVFSRENEREIETKKFDTKFKLNVLISQLAWFLANRDKVGPITFLND